MPHKPSPDLLPTIVSVNGVLKVHINGKEVGRRSKDGTRWISRMEWDIRDLEGGGVEVERLSDGRAVCFQIGGPKAERP